MKKILIALSLIASMQLAGAQVKSVADATKDLDKAIEKSENPKKSAKANTWIDLGKAYVDAYSASYVNIMTGISREEAKLMLKTDPIKVEDVEIMSQPMSKETYENLAIYFTPQGRIAAIEVLKPIDSAALLKAEDAYKKALSLDQGKSKDIVKELEILSSKMVEFATSNYYMGNSEVALQYFKEASNIMAQPPVNKLDTSLVYNVGLIASNLGKNQVAKEYLETCLKYGYYGQEGDVFARLATIDTTNAAKYLEEGFIKFPQSQSILYGLINYYVSKNNTDKIFTLLDKAKQLDPKNPSLYYVEGNVYAKLNETEKAIAAYDKAETLDPKYEWGYVGKGVLLYNNSVELQKQASMELDDAKYKEINDKFIATFKSCIDPFEKAFELAKDNNTKIAVAQYLKNIYFFFRESDPKYMELYEKYNKIASE